MSTKHNIARQLRARRSAERWTQATVGRALQALGLPAHRQTVCGHESGEQEVSTAYLDAYATIYGCQPADLLADPFPREKVNA